MTLQSGTTQEIQIMFSRLQREAREIIKSCIRIAYFMRGAVQYDSLMEKTFVERQMMSEFIEERLEIEVKNPHPIY